MSNTASAMELARLAPSPCRQTARPSRRVFCKHYDECLDFAVAKRWQGFHCGECRAYEPVQMERDEWKRDEMLCTALLVWIFRPEVTRHMRKGRF